MNLPNIVKQERETPTKIDIKVGRVMPKDLIETATAGMDEMLGNTATVKTRIVAG